MVAHLAEHWASIPKVIGCPSPSLPDIFKLTLCESRLV